MNIKPKHQGGYTERHAELCERTLVTLLRGIGPWKASVYVVGGLVPRYLIEHQPARRVMPPRHAGTTDIDLVVDVQVLATVQAYQRLEANLKRLDFRRGTNDDGQAQHFSWRRSAGDGITIVIDLLCDADAVEGSRVTELPGERRLSALKIPGAHLVMTDYVERTVTAELLDQRGVATETIRIANIVSFIVLKALAYDDRCEEKDAYDLIYCLMHYGNGPGEVGTLFVEQLVRLPNEPLLRRAVHILRDRFATDTRTQGTRKDGPVSYARFLTDPGRPERDARHRQDAVSVVEDFLHAFDAEKA